MPKRLLSAAACAEIAARVKELAPFAREMDDALLRTDVSTESDVAWLCERVPALLATVAALRDALKPFAEQRKRVGFPGPTFRITRQDWERAVLVYDDTSAPSFQRGDTGDVQEF